jgi:sigma-54 dependent transcriptional regulator, acetoin dehydrogenase operon transcriptional activator AcoR
MSPPSPLVAYDPASIWHARHAYFDEGRHDPDHIEPAVLRSWRRCSDQGRDVHDSVEFTAVERGEVSRLVDRHLGLLEIARPELASLARSVAPAGYAVLLADVSGRVLAVDGAIDTHSAPLRLAFRPGIDLSEGSIGTNAMSVAMSERQAVSVCGPEHFYADIQMFHCCAAPVFDPRGDVIGAIDVSHDMPGMLQSALWLARRCAQRIERRLFQSLPAHLRLEIDVDEGECPAGSSPTQAWLALGRDGELIAASHAARQLMGLPARLDGLGFEPLFGERFEAWRGRWRGTAQGAPLQLHNGIRLRALPMAGAPHPADRPAVTVPARVSGPRPNFGDRRLDSAFEKALRAFQSDLPVLICGETGCGKEVAARALHAAGARSAGPFVAFNCAAIPNELLAGELFGHVEGAFTGSRRGGVAGKVEAAHGGTLFLDEIGDMPLHVQAALLRVLDAREVVRLGEAKARPVDLRIVCATHRDLRRAVAEGRFREDLFYRIAGHELRLLPLRERQDFDAILDALLVQAGEPCTRVQSPVRRHLRGAPWPGNVRQLAHALRRAIALTDPGQDLPMAAFEQEDQLPLAPPPAQADPTGSLRQVEAQAIEQALQASNGHVGLAAQQLGIGRATLYRRLAAQKNGGK